MSDRAQAAQTAIREATAARLREITRDNGYRTDIGSDVRTEPSQFEAGNGPRITVWPGTRTRPADAGSRGERLVELVLEILVPTTMESPMAELEAAEADVEDLFNDVELALQPSALPLVFLESLILDRPDGMPAMASQVMFGTRYRR
jgi:hypothetical protein